MIGAIIAVVIIGGSIAVVVASTAFHCGYCDCMAFVYETEGHVEKAGRLRKERNHTLIRGVIFASVMSATAIVVAWSAP